MKALFKPGAMATMGAIFLAGCTSTMPINEHKAQRVTVNAVTAQGVGNKIGTVELLDSPSGLLINTDLNDLPHGTHGFHIHEKGFCGPAEKDGKMGAALAAGGHFNPNQAPHHGTPLTGHLGDLPLITVEASGKSQQKLLAPRLNLADVQGLAIMVHAGGDNYADEPKPLGGGGNRIACGVIQ
jgi:Cu-Zn family superoxide dismutase